MYYKVLRKGLRKGLRKQEAEEVGVQERGCGMGYVVE